jgi:hypothetical protein
MSRYLLLGLVLFSGSLMACAPIAEGLCDQKCDCEGCSDAEWDDCVSHYDSTQSQAEHYDCVDYYDEWTACLDDTVWCDGDKLENSCKHEHDLLKDCIHDEPWH